METAQLQRDPYGNDYISLEYEIDHLKLDEVQVDVTIYYTNGLSQVLNGFRINNSNKDYSLYHFYRPLIKNRLYFHKKLLGDGSIAFILASVNYPKKYKALNYSVCNSINENYKLFDIIPLTKKINTESVKFLDGQWFDRDIYPELYAYLGENILPNIPPKTFIKFNSSSNKLAVNKTKFYRIFWGHRETHRHYLYTAHAAGNACSCGSVRTNKETRWGTTGYSSRDHSVDFGSIEYTNITKDHWDFNTGDACPQRIPLYYHMKVKDTSKLNDVFINPFDENHVKQEIIEYQIVEAPNNPNFSVVVLDNIPYPNTNILLTIDGKEITVLNDTYGYAEYPTENEAVYFQDDKSFGLVYVHPKHIGKKVKIQYTAITKNLIRDNELLLDLFEVGEPFPLLHRMDNNPNFMLCNGTKFNKDIYKKLYAKLGTDTLPDYCAGFIASETNSSKIQKIQKYEYPQIGYVGQDWDGNWRDWHDHTFATAGSGSAANGGGACGYGYRGNGNSGSYPTSGNIGTKYTEKGFSYNWTHNLGTENVSFQFSNELAPVFTGLYWYIRVM